MTRCVSLVVLAVVIAAGCSESRLASQPESSTPSAKAGVEAASAAFHQALRTNDVETFMAYIADDVVLAPPGEAPVRGKMGVRTWYEAFLSQYRTSSLILSDQEVFVGNGWAAERGAYEWELVPAKGGSTVIDRGNYMQIWTQQPDGQWRFAREVYNSSAPAVQPEAN